MAIKKLTSFTQTTAANFGSQRISDAIPRDWDKRAGDGQPQCRVDLRHAQGQKKTPIGAGTLKKGR